MDKFLYQVELRDENNKSFKLNNNLDFYYLYTKDKSLIERTCKRLSEDFKSICKEGTDISINVMVYNKISETWQFWYAYYASSNKFSDLTSY